jgi:hypothetical protein
VAQWFQHHCQNCQAPFNRQWFVHRVTCRRSPLVAVGGNGKWITMGACFGSRSSEYAEGGTHNAKDPDDAWTEHATTVTGAMKHYSLFATLVATTHAIVNGFISATPSSVTRVPCHHCYCCKGSRKIWSKISFLWVVSQSWSNGPAQTETSFGGNAAYKEKLLWMPLQPRMFYFFFWRTTASYVPHNCVTMYS